ncbi:hypothetical protein QEH52_10530 [Coraliomargarita sp. SDUM461003]|uniref:PEP-CTERM protein-sorting domain-containing protein n=1 Tax=Thalassobacterium maritimum TaxID=3041265 RepID=A0ABU1AUV3_9BACT|nr:hypothetical protein [Coraliomargarita sp. SDUM461003]MDQ8207949.1 hypothetical protein [Coraliomargarita sp. SDUM461003]
MLSKTLIASVSLSATVSHAINLTIDISDLSNILLISETDHSLINATGDVGFAVGISLEDFFTSPQDLTDSVSIGGDLTARGTTLSYNETVSFAFGDGAVVVGDDLSIYSTVGGENQEFVTSAPAFTGVGTINLSAFAAAIPSIGATGLINNGYQPSQGGAIGTWSVIPEPSSFALITGMMGLVAVGARRFPRK